MSTRKPKAALDAVFVRMPPQLHEAVKERARQNDRSMSAEIRVIIARALHRSAK